MLCPPDRNPFFGKQERQIGKILLLVASPTGLEAHQNFYDVAVDALAS
jgi:hypothetical protein